MAKKLLVLGVVLMMCLGLFAGCDDNKATEQAQSGAYIAIGGEKEFAVVHEDKISIFFGSERCDVFQISKSGNSYIGENIRVKATIKFLGNNLTIILEGMNGQSVPSKKIRLKRNKSIGLSEAAAIQLEAPKNIDCSRNTVLNTYTNLSWSFDGEQKQSQFLRQNGFLGAGIEIKRPGKNDFVFEQIQDYILEPFCIFGIVIKDLNLTQGLNVLRIKHLGGPFLQSDNEIRLSKNSSEVYFNITVELDGSITAVEIQE